MVGTPLTPNFGSDEKFSSGAIQNKAVWQTTLNPYLYFAIPDSLQASATQPLYVAIEYFDTGYQKINLQYDSVNAAFTAAETSAHSSLVNTNQFATAYFVLTTPSLLKRENTGADFRLSVSGSSVSIASVMVATAPFTDIVLQRALQKPWLVPITSSANATALRGKVMAGYQEWFSCPKDLNDSG